MRSEGTAEDVVGGPLGDAEAEHAGVEVVFDDDDLSQDGVVDVVEVELPGVYLFPTARDRPAPVLTMGPVRTRLGVITGITASARTNFAALHRQPSLADLLGDLAEARLSGLRKGLHAFSTTTVFGIKPLLL